MIMSAIFLVWIRQTLRPNSVEYVPNYGMDQSKCFYIRIDAKLADAIPKYNPDSIYSNVFTKRMYHVSTRSQGGMDRVGVIARSALREEDGETPAVDYRGICEQQQKRV